MVVGPDPVLYGHVDLSPRGAFEVRSLQAFTLTYTVGRFGLHDGGAIRIVFHAIGDTGRLQTSDPSGENYVTVTTSGSSNLSLEFDGRTGARPRR